METDRDSFFASMAHLMSEAEIAQLRNAGMGQRLGFGRHPALLVIDAQNYMVGPTGPDDRNAYPSACATGRPAVDVIRRLADAFRAAAQPVFYTRNVARRDGRDMGIKLLKRGLLDIDGWYLDGTIGAEIVPALAPQPQDIVLVKTKQSGFHGTPLLDLLVAAAVDTVVITGGSTSNCVRATAIDSASFNFRTIVPRDAVFDRVRISHEVNLMDIDRQIGDVVSSGEVLDYLRSVDRAPAKAVAHG
jgi:nicotinamidase-related amidase